MKFINKSAFPAPEILTKEGVQETEKNKVEYIANKAKYTSKTKSINVKGVASFDINSKIYAHRSVKEELIKLQNKTCCFCESRIIHITSGDVEHFRPKAAFFDEKSKLFHKPGYFWLAYEWSNLLLSCELCNRRYKKTFFPLKDNSKRCNVSCSFDITCEEPLFINPCEVEPSEHITFIGTVPKSKTEEGDVTITALGLDREDLNEMRYDSINAIMSLKDIYEMLKGAIGEEESKTKFKEALNGKLNITGQYTLMFRDNFADYIREFGI